MTCNEEQHKNVVVITVILPLGVYNNIDQTTRKMDYTTLFVSV